MRFGRLIRGLAGDGDLGRDDVPVGAFDARQADSVPWSGECAIWTICGLAKRPQSIRGVTIATSLGRYAKIIPRPATVKIFHPMRSAIWQLAETVGFVDRT